MTEPVLRRATTADVDSITALIGAARVWVLEDNGSLVAMIVVVPLRAD